MRATLAERHVPLIDVLDALGPHSPRRLKIGGQTRFCTRGGCQLLAAEGAFPFAKWVTQHTPADFGFLRSSCCCSLIVMLLLEGAGPLPMVYSSDRGGARTTAQGALNRKRITVVLPPLVWAEILLSPYHKQRFSALAEYDLMFGIDL